MEFYPDISWTQFLQCCTGDPHLRFEEMMRRLFIAEYLDGKELPVSETSHPGIEVDPVLEPVHEDESPRRRISFQSKFFDKTVDYSQIKDSASVAANHYKGKLDLIYLFCNLTINPSRSSIYREAERLLLDAGIELIPISNGAILDLLFKHDKIANYYFLPHLRTFLFGDEVYTTMIVNAVGDAAQLSERITNADFSLISQLLNE